MALAIFAFNNTQQQFAIREAGGISYSVFQDFLESENENYVCEAAFQVSYSLIYLYSLFIKFICKSIYGTVFLISYNSISVFHNHLRYQR